MVHIPQFYLLLLIVAAYSLAIHGATASTADCKYALDLVFVVDSSGSICDDKQVKTCVHWRAILRFMHDIVSDVIVGDKDVLVALIIFESSAWIRWNLTTYRDKSSLLNAIDNLQYLGGNTNTIAALDLLLTVFSAERGDRKNARNEAILITDGKPRLGNDPYPMDQIRAAVTKVTDQNIHLVAVGVTDSIDMDTLKEMSSPPHKINGTVFVAEHFRNLSTVLRQLEALNCTDRPIPIAPPNIVNDQNNCASKMDLVFVVDSSGSICDDKQVKTCDHWKSLLDFIHRILSELIAGDDLKDIRVALIEFESSARIKWNLTTYRDKSSLLKAIDNLQYVGGNTNTIDALNLVRTVFTAERGDRPDSPNTAILITDGKPRIGSDPYPMEQVRAAVKAVTDRGIRLLAVGVTDSIDKETLMEMSSAPHTINKDYFMSKDYAALDSVIKELRERICKP